MIRRCDEEDFELIWAIINDGAHVYKGVIPEDCWTEPYMSNSELGHEINDRVRFWGYEEEGKLVGAMGFQPVKDVTLIRHTYVATGSQLRGMGARLRPHLRNLTPGPVLIGTWSDAVWAIRFYEKHGFQLVRPQQIKRLIKQYWSIPERQIEASVVLADPRGWDIHGEGERLHDGGEQG